MEREMYGYYKWGKKVNGIRKVSLMHLLDASNEKTMCNVKIDLVPSEVHAGRKICPMCISMEKRQKKKERRKEMMDYTYRMF